MRRERWEPRPKRSRSRLLTDQRDVGGFVAAVARLSHGSMRIDVVGAHPKDVSYEKDLIADLGPAGTTWLKSVRVRLTSTA